ncbi:MAG: PEP-CTERM sorting domain-containing protein, partial [Planctomycetia bacterium]|nr:PEP-CTERM sorting domain-containing protein [Planctomycetia bacterium]
SASDHVAHFHLRNGSTNLGTGASVTGLYLDNSSATVTNGSNITGSINLSNNSNLSLPVSQTLSGYVFVNSGSSLTTGGNITAAGGFWEPAFLVGSGGNLTLGGDLTATGGGYGQTGVIDLRDPGSVLNAQGHDITGYALRIGWNSPGATLLNRGNLTLEQLYVPDQAFQLSASDHVGHFFLRNGSTNLGTGVSVTGLYLNNSTATVTNGNSITGTIDLSNNSSLSLPVSQTLSWYIYVNSGSSLTTSGNITAAGGFWEPAFLVGSGGNLTLGGDLTATGGGYGGTGVIDLRDAGSVLNAQGHDITGYALQIGWNSPGATLLNRGNLTLEHLYVPDQAFQLSASDHVGHFHLRNGSTNLGTGVSVTGMYLDNSSATVTNGNSISGTINLSNNSSLSLPESQALSGYVFVSSGSTLITGGNISAAGAFWEPAFLVSSGGSLTLGGHLTATGGGYGGTGYIDLRDPGSVLNAQGHDITGYTLQIGWNGLGATILNDGAITVINWNQGNNTLLTLYGGNDTFTTLNLTTGSQLIIADTLGQTTGLTLLGLSASSLNIDSTSKLILDINGLATDWILRWANPNGGDHIADLTNLIAVGRIELNNPGNYDYQIYSSPDGFTYIANAVPEPSTLLLIGAIGVGSLAYYRRHRKLRQSREDILIG